MSNAAWLWGHNSEKSTKQNIEALILFHVQPTYSNTRFVLAILAKNESGTLNRIIPKRQQLMHNVRLKVILEVWPSDEFSCRSIIHHLDQCSTQTPHNQLPNYYFTWTNLLDICQCRNMYPTNNLLIQELWCHTVINVALAEISSYFHTNILLKKKLFLFSFFTFAIGSLMLEDDIRCQDQTLVELNQGHMQGKCPTCSSIALVPQRIVLNVQ